MIKVISMMYILILVFLFINNGDKTVSVINAIGGKTSSLVKTLQGR